jgi:Alcohol dehydrogenase GroES-like domain
LITSVYSGFHREAVVLLQVLPFVPLVPQNPRLDISITLCFQGFPQQFPYFLRSEVLRNCQLEDVLVPKAGPGEVRIQVKAIGINRADAMRRRVIHNEPITNFPAGLGNEAAGIIDSLGEGVTVSLWAMS